MFKIPDNIPEELKEIIRKDPVAHACFMAAPNYIKALELTAIKQYEIKMGLIEAAMEHHMSQSPNHVVFFKDK